MTQKRSHSFRTSPVTGAGNRFEQPGETLPRGVVSRSRPRRPHSNRRTRLTDEQASYVLNLYGDIHHDRVLSLGMKVLHPIRGLAIVVGVEVRGSGGWDKLNYILQPHRGSKPIRFPVQDAYGKGLRAVSSAEQAGQIRRRFAIRTA